MKGDVPRGQLIIKGNMINGLTEEDSLKADFAKLMERLLSNSLELNNVCKKFPILHSFSFLHYPQLSAY